MIFRTFLLAMLLGCLPGAEPTAPPAYQLTDGGTTSYLTMDERRLCVQAADGQVLAAFRLVSEGGKLLCYRFGRPAGAEVRHEGDHVVVVAADGKAETYAPCPAPPEAIGWQPYELPPATADAAVRKRVAGEIRRRFDEEQRLRKEAIALAGGRLDAETMAKPEVAAAWAKISAGDEDNWTWLEQTLRKDGWIGRKSHGGQAHEALVLITLHNIQHLRMAATILAGLQEELKRREIAEMSVAGVADRLALVTAEPMAYGIQGGLGTDGAPIIPVIADGARLDANRKRIGQPALALAARQMGARILRIGEDGRLEGEGALGAEALVGLDALDPQRLRQDPVWGLEAAGKADPSLGNAIAAATGGDGAPLRTWLGQARPEHRHLLYDLLLGVPVPKAAADPETAVVGLRALYEAALAGMPAGDGWPQTMLGNLLAYSLVARPVPPGAEELARAVVLADGLDKDLARPDLASGPMGHAIADTVACVRFRQGDVASAAKLWRRAIELAGTQAPELYRRRLDAAERHQPVGDLPR